VSILKEILTFEADSSIWGIKYNAPYIALEIRNQEEQRVDYVVLNESLELITKILPSEDWLISMEALTHDELILSTFEEGETPKKKDILIYGISSGHEDGILNSSVLEMENTHFSYINKETKELTQRKINNSSEKKIIFPAHYAQDSEHLATVADFIKNTISKNKVVSADYLETDKNIIISYFCFEEETLNAYLLIADLDGNPLHQFSTGEKLNGIAFDTFFLVENRLYYIAYQNTLSALSL
jgi:hypothetical protein